MPRPPRWWALAWVLLLPWLLGALPNDGFVALRTSPDAKVVVYPRADSRRIDVMIRDNRVPLDRQTDGVSARYLDEVDAISIGGGTWFVTLHVKRDDIVLETTVQPGRVLMRLKPGTPKVEVEPPTLTVQDLIEHPPPRRPMPPVRLALAPLRGDASTLRISPAAVLQELPLWRYPPVDVSPVHGWRAVEEYRLALTGTDDEAIRAAARYRLGLEYLGLGWYREAAYYLEETLASDGPFDAPAVALATARAQLVLGRAHRARELCKRAFDAGAAETAVLVCLGTASLHDGQPAPTAVAQALLAASRVPEHRLLAGQLLLADHRYAEARRVLESLSYGLDDPWVDATLGDARYLTGDVAGAKEAWTRATMRSSLLRGRLRLRLRMADLLDDGLSEWASHIPELLELTEAEDLVAAEAHYLLAQIAETYGDPDLAAQHLNRLWDRFPLEARRSEVPETLVDVCRQRLDMLHREQRFTDEIAFFTICWRPELDALAADPELLQRTADLLVDVGLRPEALSLQLRAMSVFTRLGRDDPDALAALTRMYVETGRPKEALETLEYAETIEAGKLPAREFLVAEARARLLAGDVDGSLRAWSLAEAEGATEAPRARGLILAELGQCGPAEELLRDAGDDEARLARGRCLASLGRNDEAAAMLPLTGDDPLALEDASWLLGMLQVRGAKVPEPAQLDDPAEDPEPRSDSPSIWSALLQEEETAAAFEEKLDARRRP